MVTCFDVANYFLTLQDDDAGDSISNLKLQKLVYYAQGFHLALFDTPLFNEELIAWTHGPVVPELYFEYKDHGSDRIPPPVKSDFNAFSKKQIDLLNEIYNILGQFSAWKLRNLTHDEPPWKNTEINSAIKHDTLSEYFKTQLVAQ